jgi:hypothetical protein
MGTVWLPMITSEAWVLDLVPEDGRVDVDPDGAPEDGTPEEVPPEEAESDVVSDAVSDEVSDETCDEVLGETLGVPEAALPVLPVEERPGVKVPEFPDWVETEGVEEVAVAVAVTDALAPAPADVSPTVTVTVRALGSMVTVETLPSQVSIE